MADPIDDAYDRLKPFLQEIAESLCLDAVPDRHVLAMRVTAFCYGVTLRLLKEVEPDLAELPYPDFVRYMGGRICTGIIAESAKSGPSI